MTAKPNGADRLADAFRDAISEAIEPLRKDIKDVKADVGELKEGVANLRSDMDERFNRVDTDMQSGFAELRPSE